LVLYHIELRYKDRVGLVPRCRLLASNRSVTARAFLVNFPDARFWGRRPAPNAADQPAKANRPPAFCTGCELDAYNAHARGPNRNFGSRLQNLVRISDRAEEGAVMRPAKAISCILSIVGVCLTARASGSGIVVTPLSGQEQAKSHGRAVHRAVPLSDHGSFS
jgi:hypothetical protein